MHDPREFVRAMYQVGGSFRFRRSRFALSVLHDVLFRHSRSLLTSCMTDFMQTLYFNHVLHYLNLVLYFPGLAVLVVVVVVVVSDHVVVDAFGLMLCSNEVV